MVSQCLHGFAPEHCAACRTCPHGLMTSRCGRCSDPVISRAAAKIVPEAQAPIEHRGHEIFFVPTDRSWYYREEPDGAPSARSFGSAFKARRAVDEALDNPPVAAPSKKRK